MKETHKIIFLIPIAISYWLIPLLSIGALNIKAVLICFLGIIYSLTLLSGLRIQKMHMYPWIIIALHSYSLIILNFNTDKLITMLYLLGSYYFGIMLATLSDTNIKRILNFILFSLSVLIVMQYLGISIFWKMREIFGGDQSSGYYDQIQNRLVPPALDMFSVPLSYKILTITFMIGVLQYRVFSYTLLAGILLFLIQAKSALLGLLTRNAAMLFTGFIAFALLLYLGYFTFDGSAVGRLILFQTAVNVIVEHPLGITDDYFDLVNTNQVSDAILDLSIIYFDPEEWIRLYSPHNAFLNLGIYFGIFGYIALFFFIRWQFHVIATTQYKMILLFIFTAASVNGFFHNAGLLYSDPDFAIAVAFLSSRYRLSYLTDKIRNA